MCFSTQLTLSLSLSGFKNVLRLFLLSLFVIIECWNFKETAGFVIVKPLYFLFE